MMVVLVEFERELVQIKACLCAGLEKTDQPEAERVNTHAADMPEVELNEPVDEEESGGGWLCGRSAVRARVVVEHSYVAECDEDATVDLTVQVAAGYPYLADVDLQVVGVGGIGS